MSKILVRVPQWLGDAVVSTVFVTQLKNRDPKAEISVLLPVSLSDIYSTHPDVSSVLSYRPGQSVFSVAGLLKSRSFDKAYILPRSFRTAMEACWAGIPQRIGFSGDGRRLLLTEAVPYQNNLGYAQRYLKLLGDESLPIGSLTPHFPSVAPETGKADMFKNIRKPILGIAPASIAPARTWSEENFSELAKQFHKEWGGTIILFGSPRESNVTARIKQTAPEAIVDAAGSLSLRELGWAVAQCDVMAVNDSGLMHVASCFQVPTVVLFGASDPTWALPPWGRFSAIQHKEVSCVPCLKNTCVRFGEFKYECLKRISVSEVMDALRRLLK